MKNTLFAITLTILLSTVAGCGGDSAPTADELKTKFKGEYCGNRAKLALYEDMTYLDRRIMKSFAGAPVTEVCEGTYAFIQNEGKTTWSIQLEKSTKNSNPMVSCEGSILVWDKNNGGYVVGDTLTEILGRLEVYKGKCGL